MRVQRIWPVTVWVRVWHNLHEAPVADDIKMIWYRVIHDIYPTHVRLHRINIITRPLCRHCNTDDDLHHRLVDCGEGRLMWDWTRNRLARILQTTYSYFETDTGRMGNEARLYHMPPPNDGGRYCGYLLTLWYGDCNNGTGRPGKTTMIS